MQTKPKNTDLTTGPLLPKIILFALPLAASSILQLLFNAADVVVVGRFAGSEALAAVGSTGSLINLLTNLFIGMSVGANVVAARALGAKDDTAVSQTVHTAVLLSFVSGVLLAAIGVFASPTLLRWMGSPEDVIGLATVYLRIVFLGMPVMMLYNFGAALLRAEGDTRRPLYCLALAGVINVGLNLFFVIRLNMSVAGVALATVISQTVSAALVLWILSREPNAMRLCREKLKVYRPILLQIVQIGLPAGLQGTVFSISNVVIQSAINTFGSVVIAGNAAAASIEAFVYVAMNACHQACITFTSQNVGAGKYENINRVLLYCLGCVAVVGTALGVGATMAGSLLCGIYSSDPAVIAAGVRRLQGICRVYALCGIMDVLVGSLRGLGYSVMPMIVSLIGSCALRLVWVATVFRMVGTIQSLYLSYPITWILTSLAHLVCFAVVRRRFPAAKTAQASPAE